MDGLEIELRSMFAFFRIPFNSLLMDTYFFPPKTTVIGFAGAAAGWNEAQYLRNLKRIAYGLIIEDPGEVVFEIASIFKSKDAPIYPIHKRSLSNPRFRVFLASDKSVVAEIMEGLDDPKYALTLGDSECVFYPASPRFYKHYADLERARCDVVRCILPSAIFNTYFKELRKRDPKMLTPRDTKIPADFESVRGMRRSKLIDVKYYSGMDVMLREPIGVHKFDKEPVYLF